MISMFQYRHAEPTSLTWHYAFEEAASVPSGLILISNFDFDFLSPSKK